MSKRIDIRNDGPRNYITVSRNGPNTGVLVTLNDEDGAARVFIPDRIYETVREAMDYEYNNRPTKESKP